MPDIQVLSIDEIQHTAWSADGYMGLSFCLQDPLCKDACHELLSSDRSYNVVGHWNAAEKHLDFHIRQILAEAHEFLAYLIVSFSKQCGLAKTIVMIVITWYASSCV